MNILEKKTTKTRGNYRYIASQITIWNFFGIPQSTYLAFSKDEKSRMLN